MVLPPGFAPTAPGQEPPPPLASVSPAGKESTNVCVSVAAPAFVLLNTKVNWLVLPLWMDAGVKISCVTAGAVCANTRRGTIAQIPTTKRMERDGPVGHRRRPTVFLIIAFARRYV